MSFLEEAEFKNTSVIFLHQTRTRSQLIYTITLFIVFITLISLPFIYTTVSVNGTGLLQSNIEKTEILAPVNGKITSINLIDNKVVKKGTLLLSIDAALTKQQITVLNSRNNEAQNLLHDAQNAVNTLNLQTENCQLKTGLYAASWQQYTEQNHNALNAKEQALKIYKRYETLYNKKVVTQSEYEQYKFNYEQAVSDWQMVAKKYKTQWQAEANQYRSEIKDVQNQKIQLKEQEKLYNLTASVTGSLQNLSGLQLGAFVYANQKLGEISPDSALLAFCYVKPADIGLIRKGQTVRFQMEAFNYNQWGILTGKVIDISNDIIMQEQTPYFRVKCQLDKNFLQLKNGYKGYIKKGMTFSAHFTVAKRSLYQLLYDKVDDWVNPSLR